MVQKQLDVFRFWHKNDLVRLERPWFGLKTLLRGSFVVMVTIIKM